LSGAVLVGLPAEPRGRAPAVTQALPPGHSCPAAQAARGPPAGCLTPPRQRAKRGCAPPDTVPKRRACRPSAMHRHRAREGGDDHGGDRKRLRQQQAPHGAVRQETGGEEPVRLVGTAPAGVAHRHRLPARAALHAWRPGLRRLGTTATPGVAEGRVRAAFRRSGSGAGGRSIPGASGSGRPRATSVPSLVSGDRPCLAVRRGLPTGTAACCAAHSGTDASPAQRRLRRETCRSVADLEKAISRYIREHKVASKPFVWTKPASIIFTKLSRCP
jgi:hypothetical protein